ncbi:O-antigen ligase family protein [Sphingomonas desiccabilis]|uniref:O-antigen ligase family protein n=1 Tax=Sphingomonas desiccabilis TaxID=429134 RepID=A0A4Q2IVF0_9SPHN|nr:O-antigen ligase family protein [Sphingomonas desiccabilis]MBB3912717.1 O-antigen ligase [Sphingomonas desiccabilis]RXZ34679.1 O-antigen ligase family protein [Sphingomonas desiccabilis]
MSSFRLCAALVFLAVVLGGGGTPAPWPELILQLLFLAAAILWVAFGRSGQLARGRGILDVPVLAGVTFLLLLVGAQLIGLPPGLWSALPGREQVAATYGLFDAQSAWHPMTVAPGDTVAAALSLIPPLLMLLFVAQLRLADRTRLLAVLAGAALLSALLGALQVAEGGSFLRLYAYTHVGFATGFHANRNAAADLFLVGILAAITFAAAKRHSPVSGRWRLGALGAGAFLTLVVLLTGSRTGTVLLLPVFAVGAVLLAGRGRVSRRTLLGGSGVLLALAALVMVNPMLRRTADRFFFEQDARVDLWTDSYFAVEQTWPLGAGLGSFVPVFLTAERLEAVDPSYPNRAHNDYLEFALEAGLPGLVLLAFVFGAVVWRVRKHLAAGGVVALHATFAAMVITLFALHSIVDYPMRSMSLAVIAAMAIALLAREPVEDA